MIPVLENKVDETVFAFSFTFRSVDNYRFPKNTNNIYIIDNMYGKVNCLYYHEARHYLLAFFFEKNVNFRGIYVLRLWDKFIAT